MAVSPIADKTGPLLLQATEFQGFSNYADYFSSMMYDFIANSVHQMRNPKRMNDISSKYKLFIDL